MIDRFAYLVEMVFQQALRHLHSKSVFSSALNCDGLSAVSQAGVSPVNAKAVDRKFAGNIILAAEGFYSGSSDMPWIWDFPYRFRPRGVL